MVGVERQIRRRAGPLSRVADVHGVGHPLARGRAGRVGGDARHDQVGEVLDHREVDRAEGVVVLVALGYVAAVVGIRADPMLACSREIGLPCHRVALACG